MHFFPVRLCISPRATIQSTTLLCHLLNKQQLQTLATICADEIREIQGEDLWGRPQSVAWQLLGIGFLYRVRPAARGYTLLAPFSAADIARSGTTEGGTVVQPYPGILSDPVRLQKLPVPVVSLHFYSTAVTFRLAGSKGRFVY